MKTLLLLLSLAAIGSSLAQNAVVTYVADKTITVHLNAGETAFIPASSPVGTKDAPQSSESIFIVPKSGDIQVLDGFMYKGEEFWGLAAELNPGSSFIRSSNGTNEKVVAKTNASYDLVYWREIVK